MSRKPCNCFAITFSVLTPESAADGDYAERGMLHEGLTLREARDLLRFEGFAIQADSSHGAPRWLEFSPDTDYRTGAETSKALHFPRMITPSSACRVARLFGYTPA